MNAHCSEDDLVLFFYGEGRGQSVQVHLDGCPTCSALYGDIAATLTLVNAPETPARDDRYGLEVWQRLRPVLPVRAPAAAPVWWMPRAVLGGVMAAAVVLAFLAGERWGHTPSANRDQTPTAALTATAATENGEAADRMRIAAIGDHLEQSERLLLDFVNAGGTVVDVRAQQAVAADLIDTNRLCRDAADGAGEVMVAEVLDALERSLIEIVHGPSTLSPADFDKLRMRLDAASLLFKVRVLADELRDREISPVKPLHKDA